MGSLRPRRSRPTKKEEGKRRRSRQPRRNVAAQRRNSSPNAPVCLPFRSVRSELSISKSIVYRIDADPTFISTGHGRLKWGGRARHSCTGSNAPRPPRSPAAAPAAAAAVAASTGGRRPPRSCWRRGRGGMEWGWMYVFGWGWLVVGVGLFCPVWVDGWLAVPAIDDRSISPPTTYNTIGYLPRPRRPRPRPPRCRYCWGVRGANLRTHAAPGAVVAGWAVARGGSGPAGDGARPGNDAGAVGFCCLRVCGSVWGGDWVCMGALFVWVVLSVWGGWGGDGWIGRQHGVEAVLVVVSWVVVGHIL